jgi:hypothetical protein
VLVDVLVVSYNSRDRLRACVEPLAALDDVRVIVVDNASPDGSLDAVVGLPVTTLPLRSNRGFAHGVNAGVAAGTSPYVLLLNPDTRMGPEALRLLVHVLEREPRAGAAAPRIVDEAGVLDFSQRRFPRLVSTYSQALFLHRIWPRATWVDDVVRDERAYERPGSPEWVSGACILVRRELLERLGGLDDGFFLYREDTDLCRRLRDAGYQIRYEPRAVVVHAGGASTPTGAHVPTLAASRVRYARKHRSRLAAALERGGVALSAATHVVLGAQGPAVRRGHLRSLRSALSTSPYPLDGEESVRSARTSVETTGAGR